MIGFPKEIFEDLKYYVYRLIDPRNGETFYVGKGKDNRVFAHASGVKTTDGNDMNEKIARIVEIINSGFEVGHVIHRHGMDEDTAFEVECALIDAYPGLANKVGGVGGNDFGVMHANEIITRYAPETAKFDHKVIMINVNKSFGERLLYDATRFAWKINKRRAIKADVVLSVRSRLIVGAFVAEKWVEATQDNFPLLEKDLPGKYGFIGHEAPKQIQSLYVGKKIPGEYCSKGAMAPVKYNYL